MDKAIDSRFERLERALANLIDSVAKYNPSLNLARDLDNADRDLCQGLAEGNFCRPHPDGWLGEEKEFKLTSYA